MANTLNVGEITYAGDVLSVFVSLTWPGKPANAQGTPRLVKFKQALAGKYGGVTCSFNPDDNVLVVKLTVNKTQKFSSVFDEIKNALMLENPATSPTLKRCEVVNRTWGDPGKTGGTSGGIIPNAINWWDSNIVSPLQNAIKEMVPSGSTTFALGAVVALFLVVVFLVKRK